MPAEDILLNMGIRQYGHNYEQIRLALIPAHPVYDIEARFRLNNNSVAALQSAPRTWSPETQRLLILGVQRFGADYAKIRKELMPTHSVANLSAMHRSLFGVYGPQLFQVRT